MYFNHLNYPAAWRAEYSKYPEGLSILESLMQWIRQVDDMVDSHNSNQTTINGYGDRLDDFVAQYGTHLQTTITDTLSSWQASGFLDVVIDAALQTEMDNLAATTEQTLVTFSQQLEEIVMYVSNDLTQTEIQDILNTYTNVVFRSGVYPINLTNGLGLSVKSSSKITFETGAILEAVGSSLENYTILGVQNVENVTLVDVKIKGERSTHIGTTGEWCFGINLTNTNNIKLIRANVSDCWGDGIYVGSNNKNTFIDNPTCDNNRRQGISVISADGLIINSPILTNTNGVAPEAGIDFEPNNNTQHLKGIVINNMFTGGNKGSGLQIVPFNLNDAEKTIDITVNGHRDKGSIRGLLCALSTGELNGKININNPIYENSIGSAIHILNWGVKSPAIVINKPTILKPNRTPINSTKYDSAVLVTKNDDAIKNTYDMGNIHIYNPTILSDAQTKTVFYMSDVSTQKLKSVSVIDPLEISDAIENKLALQPIIESGVITDQYKRMIKNVVGTITVYNSSTHKTYTNKGTSGQSVVIMSSSFPIGIEVTLIVEDNGNFIFIPQPSENILPNNNVLGKGLSSNVVGSRIKLVKVSTTSWRVLESVGTWVNVT